MRKLILASGVLGLALGIFSCAQSRPEAAVPSPTPAAALPKTVDAAAMGLKITDQKVGTGAEAVPGKEVVVNYTGWLPGSKKPFDTTVGRGPFKFRIAAGEVVKGWDLGVAGMKVGGKRNLVIPGPLAYGAEGAGGGLIPPNATLVFDIELLEIK